MYVYLTLGYRVLVCAYHTTHTFFGTISNEQLVNEVFDSTEQLELSSNLLNHLD